MCQYFGFDEKTVAMKKPDTGVGEKIATGDLICYTMQSNSASCCANLRPSVSLQFPIPNVQCKYGATHAGIKSTQKTAFEA